MLSIAVVTVAKTCSRSDESTKLDAVSKREDNNLLRSLTSISVDRRYNFDCDRDGLYQRALWLVWMASHIKVP